MPGRAWVQVCTHLCSCKQKDLSSKPAAPSDAVLGNSSPGHGGPQVSTPQAQEEQEAAAVALAVVLNY